jgi:hypothetical protein
MLISFSMLFCQTVTYDYGAENESSGNVVSVANNEYSTIANPSGLAFSDSNNIISVSTTQNFTSTLFRKYSLATKIKTGKLIAGVLVNNFGGDAFRQNCAAIALAHKINSIALGATITYLQTYAEGYSSHHNISINLGATININNKINIGTYIANINQNKYTKTQHLPTIMSIGLKYKPYSTLIINAEIEKYIDYKPNIKLGTQYTLNKYLLIAVGINCSNIRLYSGIGINSKKLSIWCSYSYNYYLSSMVQITLKYKI